MFRFVSIIGMVGTAAVCALHYVTLGRKRWAPQDGAASVHRFTLSERIIHALSLLACLVLAATGFWAAIALGSPLHGLPWMVHAAAGAVFALATVFMTLVWATDCRFARHDWTWIKLCGGYLGGDAHVTADRFNAGQKAYFWTSVLLGLAVLVSGLGRMVPVFDDSVQETIYRVHRYGALLFVMSVMVHLYLATLANTGTVRSIILGKVDAEWAAHHHPLWLEDASRTGSKD